jgi:hypothetical protein
MAKNNFCSTSDPVVLAFGDFGELQKKAAAAHITFGSDSKLPKDRSALSSLALDSGVTVGEGDVVRLAAYVIDAHYSNVSSGESVNCKTKGDEWNDIHIVLGTQPDADACESITAEMSPHFRPEIWTPSTLNNLAGRPLRFAGQLFFDASHRPCEGGSTASPPRRSLFEIHPVYAVDVCKTKPAAGTEMPASCDASKDENWVHLEDWVGATENDSETNDTNN